MSIHRFLRLFVAAMLITGFAGVHADIEYTGPNRDENGDIVPPPKGERCVEPTAEMRANHMEFLLHKRNETMYQGIRTKQHSLVQCINCHATPDRDGKIVRVSNDRHFCASCHRAASVKLDCFECHADRPLEAISRRPSTQSRVAASTALQQEVQQ